jgi:hypothetical protein
LVLYHDDETTREFLLWLHSTQQELTKCQGIPLSIINADIFAKCPTNKITKEKIKEQKENRTIVLGARRAGVSFIKFNSVSNSCRK